MSSMRKLGGTPRRQGRPKPHREGCPRTGKVRYRDAEDATDALHALQNRAALADERGGHHTILVRRKYQCASCRGWHLTSWESWGAPIASAA